MSHAEFGEHIVPSREAIVFLIYRDGKVLLEKRINPEKTYYGYTIVPGGKVEKKNGESHQDAMLREAKEEKGIIPTSFILLGSYENVTPSHNHYQVHAYLITDYEGEVVDNEKGKAESVWVPLVKAISEVRFVDSKYVLLLAQKALNEEERLKG